MTRTIFLRTSLDLQGMVPRMIIATHAYICKYLHSPTSLNEPIMDRRGSYIDKTFVPVTLRVSDVADN